MNDTNKQDEFDDIYGSWHNSFFHTQEQLDGPKTDAAKAPNFKEDFRAYTKTSPKYEGIKALNGEMLAAKSKADARYKELKSNPKMKTVRTYGSNDDHSDYEDFDPAEEDEELRSIYKNIDSLAENQGKQAKNLIKDYQKSKQYKTWVSSTFKPASDNSKLASFIADNILGGLVKEASDTPSNIAYHASPVLGIKKFKRFEDTSGNNKGKIIFASKDPSFSAAFGVRWNDANAHLAVETTTNKPPTKSNYKRTVLKVSDEVNLDAPCSMYKLKGVFKPLRYEDDVEEYTDADVEIVSEEQFKSFRDLAKFYGLELREIKKSTVLQKLKGKKTSNFEKAADYLSDEILKEANAKARLIESALGAVAGGGVGALADSDNRTRGALIGAGIGGIGAPAINYGLGKNMSAKVDKFNETAGFIGKKSHDNLGMASVMRKTPDGYTHTEFPLEQALAMKKREAAEAIGNFNKSVHNTSSVKQIYPDAPTSEFINPRSTGQHSESMRDMLWSVDKSKSYASAIRDESKGIADKINNQTDGGRLGSLKSVMRGKREKRKIEDNEGSILKTVTNYKDLRDVSKLRDITDQMSRRKEIFDKYLADGAPGLAKKQDSDKVFGNIRGYKNNAKEVAEKRISLENDLGTSDHNKLYNLKDRSEYTFEKPEHNTEFNKAYREAKRDGVKSSKPEVEDMYKKDKAYANARYEKWEERANRVGSSSGGYGSGYGGSSSHRDFSTDPHDVLKSYDVDPSTIKTKKDVDSIRRRLAKKWHPDINKEPGAAEKMKRINSDLDKVKNTPWYEKLSFQQMMEGIEKLAASGYYEYLSELNKNKKEGNGMDKKADYLAEEMLKEAGFMSKPIGAVKNYADLVGGKAMREADDILQGAFKKSDTETAKYLRSSAKADEEATRAGFAAQGAIKNIKNQQGTVADLEFANKAVSRAEKRSDIASARKGRQTAAGDDFQNAYQNAQDVTGKTTKARALTIGAVGTGVTGGIAGETIKHNNEEKTASDFVLEMIEKEAGIVSGVKNYAGLVSGKTLKGARETFDTANEAHAINNMKLDNLSDKINHGLTADRGNFESNVTRAKRSTNAFHARTANATRSGRQKDMAAANLIDTQKKTKRAVGVTALGAGTATGIGMIPKDDAPNKLASEYVLEMLEKEAAKKEYTQEEKMEMNKAGWKGIGVGALIGAGVGKAHLFQTASSGIKKGKANAYADMGIDASKVINAQKTKLPKFGKPGLAVENFAPVNKAIAKAGDVKDAMKAINNMPKSHQTAAKSLLRTGAKWGAITGFLAGGNLKAIQINKEKTASEIVYGMLSE